MLNLHHATIKHIKIQNFKSFKNIDLKLENFNVIIGSNASGKSNFVQIFNFLNDIHKHGLNDAILLQGGQDFVQNFKIGYKSNLMFEFQLSFSSPTIFFRGPVRDKLYISDLIYHFEIKFNKQSGFKIINDKAIFNFVTKRNNPDNNNGGSITITNNNGKLKLTDNLKSDLKYVLEHSILSYIINDKLPPKSLLLETALFSRMVNRHIFQFMNTISIYDFDPKLAKKAVHLIGKTRLEHDGSNLAIILKNINEIDESRRKFSNLIKELLPVIENMNTENFADKSILFNIQENYFKDRQLPSSLISDGTVNIIALIIALYFQGNNITILEEPERNIHPSLIVKIVNMMDDASDMNQIILTTHNPEMVKYAKIDHIYMVTRDNEGFSHIAKPSNSDSVKQFLKNDMEIKELYIQNLLD